MAGAGEGDRTRGGTRCTCGQEAHGGATPAGEGTTDALCSNGPKCPRSDDYVEQCSCRKHERYIQDQNASVLDIPLLPATDDSKHVGMSQDLRALWHEYRSRTSRPEGLIGLTASLITRHRWTDGAIRILVFPDFLPEGSALPDRSLLQATLIRGAVADCLSGDDREDGTWPCVCLSRRRPCRRAGVRGDWPLSIRPATGHSLILSLLSGC